MLEFLELNHAGPADLMKVKLAPRLNLFTGDNGLGKSFLRLLLSLLSYFSTF